MSQPVEDLNPIGFCGQYAPGNEQELFEMEDFGCNSHESQIEFLHQVHSRPGEQRAYINYFINQMMVTEEERDQIRRMFRYP